MFFSYGSAEKEKEILITMQTDGVQHTQLFHINNHYVLSYIFIRLSVKTYKPLLTDVFIVVKVISTI